MNREWKQEGDYLISEDHIGKCYKHPSFGMISFSRQQGGKTNLFGSSIQHNNTISLVIREGQVSRGLNEDWYFGDKEIIRVEMSQSQFAELITSMNNGSGVPCTINYIQGKGNISNADFANKQQQFNEEFKDKIDRHYEQSLSSYNEIRDLLEHKKTISKSDRGKILEKFYQATCGLKGSSKFVYSQFQEQVEKTVTEAKGEIEAFAQNKLNSIAYAAINEKQDELKKIDSPVVFDGTNSYLKNSKQ